MQIKCIVLDFLVIKMISCAKQKQHLHQEMKQNNMKFKRYMQMHIFAFQK